MTSAQGFKARVDFSLVRFLACALVLRFTSGATPADCIFIILYMNILYLFEEHKCGICKLWLFTYVQ